MHALDVLGGVDLQVVRLGKVPVVADALDVAPGETTVVTVRDDGAVVLEPRGGPGE